ncbi:MAG TPA: hypothetical protein H9830_01390 [Candidatus Agrococcus pullicola]|uniref:Fe-S oxidoreductase n=1 Tax=Candidatus Agrococcus pullicola TaxID=2838429 RepID=A0A9D1YSM9_9MICO|nr:hypothetical protein [Candidatus Agrococcus pullicola]
MTRLRSLGFGLGRLARGVVDGAESAVTAPPVARAGFRFASSGAKLWGAALGGTFSRHGALTVVTGLPSWAFGRGGTCVGDTVLTSKPMTDAVLAHEDVHRKQWQRYGLAFIPLYYAAGLDPLRNRFEIEAGLEAGGYFKAGDKRYD